MGIRVEMTEDKKWNIRLVVYTSDDGTATDAAADLTTASR